MNFKVVASLVLAVLCASALADDVIVGTKANFENLLSENDHVLVEFYAPWCGHCKRLDPEYAKAATSLKDDNVKLVKIDATVETELASEYGISGYPTLKFFKKGKLASDYDGDRTAEGIASWCRKKSGPPATTIASKDQFSTWAKKDTEPKVLGFVAAGSEEEKTFIGVAEDPAVEEFVFGIVNDEALATELGAKSFPSAALLSPELINYEGKIETEELIAWILENGYPLLEELSQSVFKRASKGERSLVVGFTSKDGQGSVEEQQEIFTKVAEALKGKAIFSSADAAKFPNLPSQWGASGTKYPTLTVVTWEKHQPRIRAYDEALDFNSEAAIKWLDGCLSGGECPAFRKSEPVPEENDEPVKVIVGKTFEDIVYDKTKDVLVEFYAPWCGHCKKLTPIYDELGGKFKGVDSVVIAKIDATANGFPDTIDVRGYPTILLFNANDKENPISFDGNRDLEGLTKFLKNSASIKFDLDAETVSDGKDEL